MKVGTEDRKKLAILGVAGVGALGAIVYIYSQIFPSVPSSPAATQTPAQISAQTTSAIPHVTTPAPVDTTVVPGTARKLGTTAGSLDPTLHMAAMRTTESLLYHGSGRNIFSATSVAATAPVHIPRPIGSARPTTTAYVPPVPSGPPPISLLFFGTATRPGQPPRAFLLHGDDVVLASAGDIVQRRYKIISISSNSITVEDLSNANQQTLPLRAN